MVQLAMFNSVLLVTYNALGLTKLFYSSRPQHKTKGNPRAATPVKFFRKKMKNEKMKNEK